MLMALVPVALACALALSNLFFNSSFAEEALLRRNLCDYLSCILMFASYATLIVTARLSSVLLRCCIATCDVQQRRCRAVRACFGFWGGGRGGDGTRSLITRSDERACVHRSHESGGQITTFAAKGRARARVAPRRDTARSIAQFPRPTATHKFHSLIDGWPVRTARWSARAGVPPLRPGKPCVSGITINCTCLLWTLGAVC